MQISLSPLFSAARWESLLLFLLMMLAPVVSAQHHPSPADWRDQNIYFIFTDRFNDGDPSNNNANPQSSYNGTNSRRIHGGDFKGIEQKLNYIQALGATAIWITPIPQNVGSSGYHGYGADNFYQLQPNWGSMSDLTSMVAAAHSRGMYVVLDVVCNHTGNRIDSANSSWGTVFNAAGYPIRWSNNANQYPAPFNQLTNFHNNGAIQFYVDPNQILGELSGLDDLRTETTHVRTNMVNIYSYWIQAADFDGFRLDTAKHVEPEFWQHFNPAIRTFAASLGKSNFFQFGEVFDGSDSKCGFYTGTKAGGAFANDSVLDYPLYYKLQSALATASGNTKQLEDRFNAIEGNYDPAAEYRLVTFIDNHDQPRFMSPNWANNNTNRLAVALAFLYSARGIPCLYYGTEQNFNGAGDPDNREDMFDGLFEQGPSLGDNFNMTQGSFLHVARLNNLRRLYPSLRRGTHHNLWNDPGGPGRFAYARRLQGEEVVVMFNTANGSLIVPNRPTSYPAGTVLVNLFNTNESLAVVSGFDGLPPVELPGSSVKMFVAKSLWKPLDPVVSRQFPAHGSTNVVATNAVVLTFSKPMNTASVEQAISFTPATQGTWSWASNNTVVTFRPLPGFPGSSKVMLRVATNAVDAHHTNTFHAAFETFFHTAPASYTDSVPPTVVFHNPAAGSTVAGSILLSGVATDLVGVASVQISIDGADWVSASGTAAWSYPLETSHFLNGSHVIRARAIDTSGNVSPPEEQTVRFFNVPGPYVQRVNAGGAATTNCDDSIWSADRVYAPGTYGRVNGTNGFIGNVITGICTTAQRLYQEELYSTPDGAFSYVFDCPEGIYETTILQTETWHTGSGQRQFDVYIQGQRMLADYDIFSRAGGMNIPVTEVLTNEVADARLVVSFIPRQNNARLSAIRVQRIGEVDSDGDGIPNWWMLGTFDHSTGQEADQSFAGDDADGDGYTNYQEFLAMTSPTDPLDFPFVLGISRAGTIQVDIPGASGRLYQLEWKKGIRDTNDWLPVGYSMPGNNAPMTLLDEREVEEGIYRLRISKP